MQGPLRRCQHCHLHDCHPGGPESDPCHPWEGPESRGGKRKVKETEGEKEVDPNTTGRHPQEERPVAPQSDLRKHPLTLVPRTI